jgi:hypothetical protein
VERRLEELAKKAREYGKDSDGEHERKATEPAE